MTLEIAQTLHGYARGHRLLAHGGDISEPELHELDRLSDLSGYLPADTSFVAYHTGFPCGRYFAFACTWPDEDAPRRGTVLTHTLLIPRERWVTEVDAIGWTARHRRPASADERDVYAEPLYAEPGVVATPELSVAELRGLLALWFGQRERPLLWADERPPLAVVRALWPWLWPELRGSFAFCTFALQPRAVKGRPFDFLGVPPPALGAFHELGGSAAWWLSGQLRLGEPESWVDGLLEAGPSAVQDLLARCRAHALSAPHPGLLRAAQRYWELAEGAKVRLPAARARLDMLTRAWPELPPQHEAAVAAIKDLLARQADAPLSPRPLWDLHYLLARPYVEAQLETDTALGREILVCLRDQVRERLCHAPEASSEAIAGLYSMAPTRAREALREGIAAAARTSSSAWPAWGEALLSFAEMTRDEPLARVLWFDLPVSGLVQWLDRELVERAPSERESLRDRATVRASERGSPDLARAAWGPQVRAGLDAAASVVAVRPQTHEAFAALLGREGEEQQLEWCLDCEVQALRPLASRVGAEILTRRKTGLHQLVVRCEGRRMGGPIFVRACPWAPDREIEAALRGSEALALQLIHFLLEDSSSSSSLVNAAGRAVPGSLLWSPATRAALASGRANSAQLDVLLSRLLVDVLAGGLPTEEAGAWLAEPRVEAWLQRASTWELDRPMLMRPSSALSNLAAATGHAARLRLQLGSFLPLGRLLHSVSGDELAGQLPWVIGALADAGTGSVAGLYLHAEALGAAYRTRIAESWRIAEVAFYPVYHALVRRITLDRVSWWTTFAWDRAKHWRHWLLDRSVEYSWPSAALVRCLGDDADLAERVFKRASRLSRQSEAWLHSLRPALVREPALLDAWLRVTR